MPVPTPSGALSAAFRVLCLRCLRAKAHGIQSHKCVWSAASSKCGYCTAQHSACVLFLGEEFAALRTAEKATPLVPADVAAATTEANRVTLLAAQSVPKFRSEAERDLYEKARATRAALESGLAQIRLSLRRLWTEQESVPALLGELVAAVGKLPTAANPAVAPTRGDGRRKEGQDGEVGAAYRREDPVSEGTQAWPFVWGHFHHSSLMVVAACCDAGETFGKGDSRKGYGGECALARRVFSLES
ncbi:hypothetical protein GMDG_05952 [Pseudogymnoascus destructans 20631-21]|uniref:Uncharacterized protein n=1 Tax=Pseudogymnoascus destructans (strain ATCC MYA-4855 / 20631-21) TaxID=658429 RepID=L8FRG5_PSED2|nr:hypothetical protein GMDG_05952 [Pseudogymnoascus destructans 20631-21]